MISKISIFKKSLGEVFRRPGFVVLALLVAFIIFAVAVLLPNFSFVRFTLFESTFTFLDKVKILFTSLGAFKTGLTLEAQITTLIIAPLAGINIAMLAYYFKKRAAGIKMAGSSIFGIIGSFLGIGCASCGSVILSSLVGISATAGIVTFLPLNGAEFGILGIAAVIYSTYVVAKKIQDPLVCSVE